MFPEPVGAAMTRERYARGGVTLVVAVQAVILLTMSPFYGPHRDELYFASAGQRLAWGYPDQPPLVPLLARISADIAPLSVVVLRLWSILGVGALVALATEFARLLGAGRRGQLLTATTTAASVVVMALGHRLTTATFDMLTWTAVLVVVSHAVLDDRPRLWLLAGLVAGLGLENKTSVVFLVAGLLLALLLDPVVRPVLRTAWPWLGGLIAVVIWLPNLLWQAHHGWPVLTLSHSVAEQNGGIGGRIALVSGAALLLSPVIFVVWLAGLMQLFRRPDWRPVRFVGITFVVVTVVFLVAGGKPYYLAGLLPPLVAAGCTWLVGWRPTWRPVLVGALLALSAIVAWPALVPVLPAKAYTASFYPVIDSDQPEEIGWPSYVDQVRAVVTSLPPAQRRTAVAFAGNYGEAGALEWYAVGLPVYSGHNGFQDWGPPPDGAGPVVVWADTDPSGHFTGCVQRATLHAVDGADNQEDGSGVWVCAAPIGSWSQAWPGLSYDRA